jgi:peptide chain release factor 1
LKLPEGRLEEIEARFVQVETALADPGIASRPDDIKNLSKEHSELKDTVEMWRTYKQATSDLAEAKEMLSGSKGDERDYVESEIKEQEAVLEQLNKQLTEALIAKDPNDDRDVIVEIRAGAGGDEAGLFAAEMMRMYQRYAETHRFKAEVLSSDPTGVGGIKDVTIAVKGKGAFSRMKHEAGVHRVQRVPTTESSGRIHTSAVAVNVLPEADEVEIEVDLNDLKIDVYRSSGPGGQSVNTTDSAVRITHLPTGEVVACQDEKSQLQNKEKAMRILRARLLQRAQEEQAAAHAAEKRAQVSSADRSAKIRTYNFPDNRVTDHRIGYTTHRLAEVLEGDLDDLIDALLANERAERVQGEDG